MQAQVITFPRRQPRPILQPLRNPSAAELARGLASDLDALAIGAPKPTDLHILARRAEALADSLAEGSIQ